MGCCIQPCFCLFLIMHFAPTCVFVLNQYNHKTQAAKKRNILGRKHLESSNRLLSLSLGIWWHCWRSRCYWLQYKVRFPHNLIMFTANIVGFGATSFSLECVFFAQETVDCLVFSTYVSVNIIWWVDWTCLE